MSNGPSIGLDPSLFPGGIRDLFGFTTTGTGPCDSPRERDPVDNVCKFPALFIGAGKSESDLEKIKAALIKAGTDALLARIGASGANGASNLGPDSGCVPPFRFDPRTQQCAVFAGGQTGVDDTAVGEAVMGRYGAGLVPGNKVIDRAVCLRGMVLGNDGICYNRSQIRNADREWPRGRRPLLTGGDMRAISTAARAGRRLEGATKRLQKIGLMKKPTGRRRAPKAHPGHGITVVDTAG